MRIFYSTTCIIFFFSFAFASSTDASLPASKQTHNPKYDETQVSGVVATHHFQSPFAVKEEISFLPVVYLSILNSFVNIMRPDPAIIWQARVPRALWELSIAFVAKSAKSTQPSVCLLLCLMTFPTALVDIFLWAPSFAIFAKFETCTGGGLLSRQPKVCTSDYWKGIGRLFVTVQSLLTGVFYLFTAVVSWMIFTESRDSIIARKNALAMAEIR